MAFATEMGSLLLTCPIANPEEIDLMTPWFLHCVDTLVGFRGLLEDTTPEFHGCSAASVAFLAPDSVDKREQPDVTLKSSGLRPANGLLREMQNAFWRERVSIYRRTHAADLTRGPELKRLVDDLTQELPLLGSACAEGAGEDVVEAGVQAFDRSLALLEEVAHRKPGDLEAFEGRPLVLEPLMETCRLLLDPITQLITKYESRFPKENVKRVHDFAYKVGFQKEQQKMAESIVQRGVDDAVTTLESALKLKVASFRDVSFIWKGYKACDEVELPDAVWDRLSQIGDEVKAFLLQAFLCEDSTLEFEDPSVKDAEDLLRALDDEMQVEAASSAEFIALFDALLKLRDAWRTQQRSADNPRAADADQLIVMKGAVTAINAWTRVCGSHRVGLVGENEEFCATLVKSAKTIIEEDQRCVKQLLNEFTANRLTVSSARLHLSTVELHKYSGGAPDGSSWRQGLPESTSEEAITERFLITLGAQEFNGEDILNAAGTVQEERSLPVGRNYIYF